MRIRPILAATAFAIAATGAAAAVNVHAVMHARHEGMEAIGKAFKTLHRQFDSNTPDQAAVRAAAVQIDRLARQSSGWFPAGTGPQAGKTGAKAEIWQHPQDFAVKLLAFQNAARALNAATAANDPAATRVAYAGLGKSCKACHDDYRTDMHH